MNYPKVADSSSFDEDSSDALSPEQPASHESQGSVPSPLEARVSEPLPSATSVPPTQVSWPAPCASPAPVGPELGAAQFGAPRSDQARPCSGQPVVPGGGHWATCDSQASLAHPDHPVSPFLVPFALTVMGPKEVTVTHLQAEQDWMHCPLEMATRPSLPPSLSGCVSAPSGPRFCRNAFPGRAASPASQPHQRNRGPRCQAHPHAH